MDIIKQNKKWILLSSIVIVVIIFLIVFFFNHNEGKEKEKTQNYNTTLVGDATVDPENIDETEEGTSIDANNLAVNQGQSNGIDVSKWQGKINWNKVKEQVDFAFIRIGYRGEDGVIYKDDNADYNIQQANKAGVLVGVYFYSTALNEQEAIEEANWTLECINGYSISYPVVYDCEGYKHPTSRTYKLSSQQLTTHALAYLDTIAKQKYETMFYTSLNDLETHWNVSAIEKKHKVWIAQYSSTIYPDKQKPDYNGLCHAWQYTNKGQVSGVNGNVDMVVCYFENKKSNPKNTSATTPKAKVPLTEEEKKYSSVNEKITAKAKTNLRSSATTKGSVIATLTNGETLTRIGVGTNGWSKLNYNGQTVYAITSYLTTDLSIKEKEDIVSNQKFSPKSDKMTAKEEVNLRLLPTTDGEVVGKLISGTFLDRTAVGQNGWSRLIYNGQTVYAITSYLSDKVIEKEVPIKPSVGDGYTSVDEQVTAKTETNLRDKPTVDGSQVIHLLKNGEYVKRIGILSNGWSKIEYNGQIVYAISSYLQK